MNHSAPDDAPDDTPGAAPDDSLTDGADARRVPVDAAMLDRIEDGVGVLLVGPSEIEVEVPADLLPPDARDGDWFRFLVPDPELTDARRTSFADRLAAVRRTRRGGRFDG